MTVSGKTFLEQIKESAVSLLSTGGKNQQTAPKDTIDTTQTNKVLQAKEQEQKLADQQSTIGFKQTSQPSKYEQLMQGAERQRLEEGLAFEELTQGVQDTFIGIGNKIKNAVSEIPDMIFGKEKEKIKEEKKEIKDEQRKQQQEVKKELEKQSVVDGKRNDMYTVVDPYKMQPQYGPFVDYRQARLNVGSIGNAMKNVTLNNDATIAYVSNGLTTVSKPVITGNDYAKTLQDAYNAITYEYANFGNLVNPEIVKQYFPAWKDASDEEINRFINECAYDVEQGKRRDISMYAENFLDLSMPDGYTSKHDAVLNLYGDDDYITYGLGQFINGTATLDGKTPEQIKQYVGAIRHINRCVEKIKEMGANTQGASNYVIAKTFADDYEGLKEALDIYQNFNLTNKDLSTIDATYTAYMEDMKDFASKPIYDDEVGMWDIIYDHFNEMSKTKLLAEQDGELAFQTLNDWFMGNVYEEGGKFYDAQGNEVPRNDARIGVFKSWLQGLQGIGEGIDNMKKDLDRLQSTPTDADNYFERSQVPVFDLINTAFRVGIEFTPAGVVLGPGLTQAPVTVESDTLKEFAETEEAPTLGRIAEAGYEKFFGWLGDDVGVKLGDMIGYTDGWSEESKAKFSESFAGLATILAAKVKGKIEKAIGKKISNTTIAKSINSMKERLIKEIELIDEQYEKKKIAAKNEINKEIAPKEQIADQEKMVDKMIDQEATNRKSMFIKEAIKNSLSDFRKTFLEEYSKEEKASGESTGPTLIDKLFNKALQLGEQMKSERAAEVKADIDSIQKGEATAPEATTEIKVEDQPTPEGEQVKVEETQVEKPGATVEQTKATATAEEKAAGTAKVDEKASQQTKKQIKGILSFIADVLDMGKEIKDFNQRRYRAKKAEKAEREAENKRIIDAEALSDVGLTNEQIRQMQNNPYSETILDVIDSYTNVDTSKGKIKKVTQEKSVINDEVQRDVLSEGIKKIQEYVDKLIKMRNSLKSLYGDLEKNKNIDTSKFPESQPLQKVLKDYGYGIEIEVDPETNAKKATVYKLDGTDSSPSEMGEMKYIEDFINKQLKFENKSEADLLKNRQWLKWNEDTYGRNGRSKALENSFRDAFNKFIEEQGDVKLLRTIDKGFTTLSDALDTLRELLNKDNTVKDNAKNKILKWDNETINQLNEVIPGIKDLIELTRVAPEIVKQGVKAKTQTKSTWQKTASVVRYVFVGGAPTLIIPRLFGALGLAAGSALSIIMGSVLFKVSENFGLKMKHKIQGKIPDLDLYNTFVNNLKLDPEVKNSYKAKIKAKIEEETADVKAKTEKEFNQIIDEVAEILIERKANEIAENKLRNRGTNPEEPTNPEPKGPDDKTPPSGGSPELTPEEKEVVKQASAIEPKEHSKEAIKLANTIEEIKQTLEDAQTDDASAKLEERGEDVTPESIQKEIDNPKPKTLAEELGLVKEGEFENRTQQINIQEVSTELLQEVRENPEKFGVSEEEFLEIDEELQRRTEQNATAKMKAEDAWNTDEDAANMAEINELDQKKADAKTQEEKDAIQEQIDEKKRKAIDLVQKKRNLESNAEAEEALLEQNNASYNRIEAGKDTSVGKFRQNSYSTLLFAEKYGMKAKKPLSRTSSIENIMENPNPKTKARLLEEKKKHMEEKIKNSKYAKNREKQIAELQKVNEAIEENNKALNAIEEKVETEKVLKEKRSKATTREEKKELTKQIDKNNEELEKILDEQQKDLRDMPETEDIEALDKDNQKEPVKGNSDIREKFGDKYYEFLEEQVKIINDSNKKAASPKLKEPITVDDLDITTQFYENRFHEIYNQERKALIDELNKYPINKINGKLTDKQIKILEGTESESEKQALYTKWRKERMKEGGMSDKDIAKVEDIMQKLKKLQEQRENYFNYRLEKSKAKNNTKKQSDLIDMPETEEVEPEYGEEIKEKEVIEEVKAPSEEITHTKEGDIGKIQYKGGTLKYSISPDGKTMEIHELKAGETRKGIGTRLLQEAEKIAKELGVETLDLLAASDDNVISQENLVKFYEKNGFKVYKTHRRGIMHLMSKDLSGKKTEIEATDELPTPRESTEKFYHASDSDFSIVDMDKTKPEGNGIGFAVNLKEDHPYKDKPYQYEIEGKDFKIGGSETLLSENVLKKICDKLGIEYNEARTMIELPELSNIIAEESGKGNKAVTKVLVEETGLDGVDTSHDYTVLWNEEKINKAFKKREAKKPEVKEEKKTEEPKKMGSLKNMKPENLLKEPDSENKFLAMEYQMLKLGNQYLSRNKEFKAKYDELYEKYRGKNKTEAPKTETKEEPKEEKGAEPLVKQEDNGKAYAMKGDPTSKEIFERIQYLRNKAKQNGNKISFRDRSELEFLGDRYKTKLMEEAKQEYNPTEKQDLDREELGSIGGINVPTYGMSID